MTKNQKLLALIALVVLAVFVFFSVKIYDNSKPAPIKPVHHTASLIPNKHQEPYGFGYQYKDIEVSVFEGDSYYNADKSAVYYGFSVWYTNTQNEPENYPVSALKPIDVGCIVSGNQNFVDVPSIFMSNQTALKSAAPTGTLSFTPFEVKKMSIQLPPSCQYAGTADREYWWNVPLYGE